MYNLPITFAALRFGTRGGTIGALLAIVSITWQLDYPLRRLWGDRSTAEAVFVAVGIISAKLADDGGGCTSSRDR